MAKVPRDMSPVEIRPGVGTLGMFKFMDYTAWHAIGEFVDNSVSSWQQHRRALDKAAGGSATLQVYISLNTEDDGELRVWDNAAGIAAEDYSRAFKPAERPPDQTSLARYGMGMKTAACWFSDHWKVVSSALGEPVERSVQFDIQKLVERGQERIDPVSRKARAEDHWTELVLWDLNQIPVGRSVGKIKDHLSQMYRRFLAGGEMEMYWNDEPLTHKERQALVAPYFKDGDGAKKRWEKPLTFTLPKGETVTGRALLFERGEQSAAGLHLFWRGRMIKGNLEDFYRPQEIFQFAGSYRVQRLLVELNLDAFSPTVDKKDFIWGRNNSSEHEMLMALKRVLNRQPLPMLDQADGFRSNKVEKNVREAASKAALATAEAVEERGGQELSKQVTRAPLVDNALPKPAPGAPSREVILNITVRSEPWRIAIQLSDRPADRNQWLEITERPGAGTKGPRRLGIRISLTHPFTIGFATDPRSIALLIRIAAGLALAEIAAREAGAKNAGAVRRNLNELLLTVFVDS